MRKKKFYLLLFLIILLVSVLVVIISINIHKQYNKRLFDNNKPDIFEIESASYGTKTGEYYAYYMVQKIPENIDEAKSIINNFVENNDIPDCYGYDYNKIYVHFMMPSWDFPVYFEDNADYLVMNDYITNYLKTNSILLIRYTDGELSTYSFNEDTFNKLCKYGWCKI